jgi:hypothetical protein
MSSDDLVTATEGLGVAVAVPLDEHPGWFCEWDIAKWDEEATAWLTALLGREPTAADFEAARIDPFEVGHVERNLLTTAGLNRITSLIIGAGGQAATNTASRIGVGNGAGTAAVGDTDLSASAGSANRWFQTMDATYPQQSNGVMTFRSTFGSSDGNFAWNEFGIDVGTPTVSSGNTVAALLLNHKTSIAQGTKASGQTWTATATITLS